MAMAHRYECNRCKKGVDAWDEGNPYYRNEEGKKVYAYHPSPERNLCTGIESDIICLSCGHLLRSDSAKPRKRCTKCKSESLSDRWALKGKPCPYCKEGKFKRDKDFFAIS